MDRTGDLQAALQFVAARIEGQAIRSGQPLTDEQVFLLNNLPSLPPGAMALYDRSSMPQPLVPSNLDYERLCAVGKIAYLSDQKLAPSLDWEFALSVFELNDHPMHGLLKWAGVRRRRSAFDATLLIVTALLLVTMMLVLGFLVPFAVVGLMFFAIIAGMYFVTRRMEQRALEEEIDRCRLTSRFATTTADYPSE